MKNPYMSDEFLELEKIRNIFRVACLNAELDRNNSEADIVRAGLKAVKKYILKNYVSSK